MTIGERPRSRMEGRRERMAKKAYQRTTNTSKPGGRPKARPDVARSESVRLCFTISEKAALSSLARDAGMNMSDYIRQRLFEENGEAPARSSRAVSDPALISLLNKLNLELARTGNNANQLARATHRDSDFTQFWREIGDEVRFAAVQARTALAKVLDG